METLYLLQHEGITDYTKIGYTRDIAKRLNQLNTGSPTGIHIVYQIKVPRAYQIEQYFHRKYANKQSNLEWYRLSHEDIVDIIFEVETILHTYLSRTN